MEITIQSINELEEVVKALLNFSAGRKKIMFYGEIGAGKTTFFSLLLDLIKPTTGHIKSNDILVGLFNHSRCT